LATAWRRTRATPALDARRGDTRILVLQPALERTRNTAAFPHLPPCSAYPQPRVSTRCSEDTALSTRRRDCTPAPHLGCLPDAGFLSSFRLSGRPGEGVRGARPVGRGAARRAPAPLRNRARAHRRVRAAAGASRTGVTHFESPRTSHLSPPPPPPPWAAVCCVARLGRSAPAPSVHERP